MSIGTMHGPTPWTTQEVADFCQVGITSATRKVQTFEQSLAPMLEIIRTQHPHARTDNLAATVTAMLATGGALCRGDRDRLRNHIRHLLDSADLRTCLPAGRGSPDEPRRSLRA